MSTIIQDLCTIRYLRKAVEECEAYDGWTADDQLSYYIQRNGFNPIVELKETKERMIEKYCTHEIKEEIEYYRSTNDLNLERVKTLGDLIADLNVDKTVTAIIYELYTLSN